MSLRDLNLKISYSSDTDNVLKDFYILALSHAKHYCRLAGFFTSSALAVAAKGIANLMKNDGDMKIVCGARFSAEDINEIKKNKLGYSEIIENVLKECNGKRKKAAEVLGINRTTLYNKMRQYGLLKKSHKKSHKKS